MSRSIPRAQPKPGSGYLQKTLRIIIETGHLAPGIQIGMAYAPIVILASHPALHGDRLAVHSQDTFEHCVRCPNQRLGLWESALVERGGQEQQRRLRSRVAQIPPQRLRARPRQSRQAIFP